MSNSKQSKLSKFSIAFIVEFQRRVTWLQPDAEVWYMRHALGMQGDSDAEIRRWRKAHLSACTHGRNLLNRYGRIIVQERTQSGRLYNVWLFTGETVACIMVMEEQRQCQVL